MRKSTPPGLIARKRKEGPDRLYWSADSVARSKAKGFPDRLIRLPEDATSEEIEDLCETYTARLMAWREWGERPQWSERSQWPERSQWS